MLTPAPASVVTQRLRRCLQPCRACVELERRIVDNKVNFDFVERLERNVEMFVTSGEVRERVVLVPTIVE